MQINRLSDALGAEVTSIDVSDIDEATYDAIHEGFLEHLILVFRGQDLIPQQRIAFSEHYGEAEVDLATDHLHPETDKLILISNKQIDGRKGIHTFNRMRNPRVKVPEMHKGNARMRYAERAPPDGIHPIIRTHPDTGRKALYVSNRFTVGIEGMPDEASRPILDAIFEHQLNDELIYRYNWWLGDMIMWDNRCTTHHAFGGMPVEQVRHMYRTALIGDAPF